MIGEEGRDADELPSQIDRSFQRSLLLWMRDKYPSMAYKVPKSLDGNDRRFYLNLFYLQEHDLFETSTQENSDGFISWRGTKITAKGVDFLENDGGLSAILGVVRVKLHADTLRDILAKKIDASNASPEEKSALKKSLGQIPTIAMNSITTHLMERGLGDIPNLVAWMRPFLGI